MQTMTRTWLNILERTECGDNKQGLAFLDLLSTKGSTWSIIFVLFFQNNAVQLYKTFCVNLSVHIGHVQTRYTKLILCPQNNGLGWGDLPVSACLSLRPSDCLSATRSARAINIYEYMPACNLSQLSILMDIGFGCVPIAPLQATR